MDNEQITLIKKNLAKKLTPSRYEHTLGVAYTSAALAMRYGCDMEKAFMAGLLHDCAKYLSGERLLEKCAKYGLRVTEAEKRQPDLLHAKVGAYYAEYRHGVTDPDICHAICFHTTGCPDMNLLDMIIYVADYIEPNRDKAPRLPYFRELAFMNIEQCTYEILQNTIEYVKTKNTSVDDTTVKAFESLKAKRS